MRELRRFGPFLVLTGTLGSLFAFVAAGYQRRYHLSAFPTLGIFGCFLLLLACSILPAMPGPREAVRRALSKYGSITSLLALATVPYLIYAAGTGDFHPVALGRLLSMALLMGLMYPVMPVRDPSSLSAADVILAVLLIIDVLSGWLRTVWTVPVRLDFMGRLYLIALASWCWTFVRPVPAMYYEFRISRRVALAAGLNLLFFAAIAVPLGLVLGFTAWNPRWHGTLDFVASYLEIFLFIALLEELFFRGFLQSLLTGTLHSPFRAQVVVCILFGLFHILHAPFPNWRYVILATIAGWFYGSAWRQGGILASALTHAAVDTIWRTWLTRT